MANTDGYKKMTSRERTLRASVAAHASWAKTEDRAARTAKARAAMTERFYDEVDPERKLPPAEREKRAANARNAYFQRLALKSATAARRRRNQREGECRNASSGAA